MASVECCSEYIKATVHVLASRDKEFEFQHLYVGKKKCLGKCGLEVLKWRGESRGVLTDYFRVDPGAVAWWKRRIKIDEARPEGQFHCDWSRKVAGEITAQIQYQTKLCQAKRWYKGQRVDLDAR